MATSAKSCPSRSNSFQRMLQLEKQYMLERLQANKSDVPSPASPSRTARQQPTSPPTSPRRSSIQARRADVRAPKVTGGARHHAAHPSQPIHRPAPLAIATDSTWLPAQGETAMEPQLPINESPVMVMDPSHTDMSSPSKVVAFEFPPQEMDQRSICVSPSWEAHGRRKREKKMMEKQKNEAAKANEGRVRKGRLSKPPPPTVPVAPTNKKDTEVPRGRQKERRSSEVMDRSKDNQEGAPPRKARSRSSSLISMMRAPFEFRRSSADSSEPEFIGGIKLELERHIASENMLQGAQRSTDVDQASRFHDNKPKKRWSSPLKSPPPPPRGPHDSQDPTRRAYPPITRYTNASKTRSLISPTAPTVPDLSKIDKWRARVGLRPASRTAMRTPEQDVPLANDSKPRSGRATTDSPQITTASGGLSSPFHAPATQPAKTDAAEKTTPEPADGTAKRPSHITFAYSPPRASRNGESKTEKDCNNNESIQSSCSDGRSGLSNGYQTAPSTPPPDPPNRSPERHPLKMHGPVAYSPGSAQTPHDALSAGPSVLSIPESQTPKQKEKAVAMSDTVSTSSLTPKATPVSPFKMSSGNGSRESVQRLGPTFIRKPTSMQYPPSTQLSPPATRNMPISSSEESSEELHSPSPPSTPATSRAESEKGLYLPHSYTPTPVYGSANNSIKGADTTDEEDQYDVQAAADKVLASLTQAASSMANQRRGKSQSFVMPEKGLLPVPKTQTSRTHVRGSTLAFAGRVSAPQSRDQSPRPAPAAYLEEARKMPPNMPASRGARQRLGPPASFVLPRNMSSTTMLTESSRSSDTIGRSAPLPPALLASSSSSAASLAPPQPQQQQQEKDPLAKVFVECCSCKFYHDMPSTLYEAMANPEGVLSGRDTLGFTGSISMTIKCPWCKHEMSTRCCAGLAAMVYVKERLH